MTTFAKEAAMPDTGTTANGGDVGQLIDLPARQRRIVRRRSAPDAKVYELAPALAERQRQIDVVRFGRRIRAMLAEAGELEGVLTDAQIERGTA